MTKMTVVEADRENGAIYLDGEKHKRGRLDRMWPQDVLEVVEDHDIEETEFIYDVFRYPLPRNLKDLEGQGEVYND